MDNETVRSTLVQDYRGCYVQSDHLARRREKAHHQSLIR